MKAIVEEYGAIILGVAMTGAFVVLVRELLYGSFRDMLILAADMIL